MNRVLLFADLKEKCGSSRLEVEADGKTVRELKRYLEETMALDQLDSVLVAVNEEFGTDDCIIREGDEIALIPPVSGG